MKKLILTLLLLLPVYSLLYPQCYVTIKSNNVVADTFEICPGDPITLYAETDCGSFFFDDFNDSNLGPEWIAHTGVLFNNPCPPTIPPATGAVCWMKDVNINSRYLTTTYLFVPVGPFSQVKFDMKYGDVQTSVNCEDPDQPDEGVHLQFSTNGGATWTDINFWVPTTNMTGPLYTWNHYSENIPAVAQGQTVIFRWYQAIVSGPEWDHWGVDNVEINTNVYNDIIWSTGDTLLNPPPMYPSQSGYISCTVYDFFNGVFVSDSVYVKVNNLTLFNVTGGGYYCQGGQGVNIGLDGSEPVIVYQLYRNGNPFGTAISGSGGAISFGNQTSTGTYTVKAENPLNGCGDMMNGQAVVSLQTAPVADAGPDQTIASASSTNLNGSVTGGTAPYIWSWSPSAKIDGSPTVQNPKTTNLNMSQIYTLEVSDSYGCVDSDIVTISISGGALTVNPFVFPDTVCGGDFINLLANPGGGTGNYSFSWTSSPSGFTSILQNPVTYPTITTTYNVTVNDGINTASGSVTVNVTPAPVSNAGSDATICENNSYLLDGSGYNYTSAIWSTAGDGYFDNNTILTPHYTPGPGDIAAGSIYLTLLVYGDALCGPSSDFMKLTINKLPTVSAGQDKGICAGDIVHLYGSANNWNFILWSTSGDGSFNNPSNFYTTYTPGTNDIINGTVTLSLTAFGNAPCGGKTSSMILTIYANPTPLITGPIEVCAYDTGVIYNTPLTTGNIYNWAVTGGIVSSGQGTNEISVDWGIPTLQGIVAVTETNPLSGCYSVQTLDSIHTLQPPIANAGPDQFIPGNSSTQLNGTVKSGSGSFIYQWSPDSLLVDPTIEDPVTVVLNATTDFYFVATDVVTGCISNEDIVTVYNSGTLSLNPVAVPDTICIGETGALFSNASGGTGNFSYLWTSDPPGFTSSLEDPVVSPYKTTKYNLTVDDGVNTIAGSVTVTVSPSADAGPDTTICIGSTYLLPGSAQIQGAILWNTTGDGTFDDNTILQPLYTPGPADISTESVKLILNAAALLPCLINASDTMKLSIQKLPQANAGPDVTICEDDSYALAATAAYNSYVLWTTTGDGIFNNIHILSPVYTPGVTDITNASVDLIITAYAKPPCTINAYDTITVSLVMNPKVNLGNDTTICVNDSITLQAGNPGCNYIWSTGATKESIVVSSSAPAILTYYVIVTNSFGCIGNGSITVTFDPCTSMDNDSESRSINIFPNPNTGQFNIMFKNIVSDIEMQIMNVHGQVIKNDVLKVPESDYTKDFGVGYLPKGIYFIIFKGKDVVKIDKLIIR